MMPSKSQINHYNYTEHKALNISEPTYLMPSPKAYKQYNVTKATGNLSTIHPLQIPIRPYSIIKFSNQ